MKLIDMHCDTPMKLYQDQGVSGLRENNFCVDLSKLKKSNCLAQFFALFIYMKPQVSPRAIALSMLQKLNSELEINSELISTATSYEDILKNESEGKMSALITIEEGGAIEGSLHNLRDFYNRGVRLMTLTWNFENEIGYPHAKEEYRTMGLKPFGFEVIEEMNRLGMIIDVSHLSDAGFYDVASHSKKPFVASHSNARTITPHSRNLSDPMIKLLAENGGVIGINYVDSFLSNTGFGTLEDIVTHIKHIEKIGGIDVLALGSDFDGTPPKCELQHIGEMELLYDKLQKCGFSEDKIDKIFYKNALRVVKANL